MLSPEARSRHMARIRGKDTKPEMVLRRAMHARGKSVKPAFLEEMMTAFVADYEANMPGKTRIFDGAMAALDRFSNAGYIHAICTNKYEGMSRKLLDKLGVAGRFAAICGQDTFAFKKPDPRHLTETIKN